MPNEVLAGTEPDARRQGRGMGPVWLAVGAACWSALMVLESILSGHSTVSINGVVVATTQTVVWGVFIPASIALVASLIAAILAFKGKLRKSRPWFVVAAIFGSVAVVGMVLALVALWLVSRSHVQRDGPRDAGSANA